MQGKMILGLIMAVSLIGIFPIFGSAQIEMLNDIEQEMAEQQAIIGTSLDYDERKNASARFRELLMTALDYEGCFEYEFGHLKTVSTIYSPDNKFRIFNWNLPNDDETHEYFCFILHWDKKSKSSSWEELTDPLNDIPKIENKYLKPDQWLGALYYEIIPCKISKNKTFYTLLGWDGNNRSTTKKIIDVISFEGGKTKLGAPIFKMDKGTQKRVILEYSSEAMVSLKWHAKEKRIVFDHLAPRDPSMTGVYSFYGPDLSYDSFNYEKGKWIYKANVDARNTKNNRPYNDPEKLN